MKITKKEIQELAEFYGISVIDGEIHILEKNDGEVVPLTSENLEIALFGKKTIK